MEWIFTLYGAEGIGLAILLIAHINRAPERYVNFDMLSLYGSRICPDFEFQYIKNIIRNSELFTITVYEEVEFVELNFGKDGI